MISVRRSFYLLTIQNIEENSSEYSQDIGSHFLFHAGLYDSCAGTDRSEVNTMRNCPPLLRAIFCNGDHAFFFSSTSALTTHVVALANSLLAPSATSASTFSSEFALRTNSAAAL